MNQYQFFISVIVLTLSTIQAIRGQEVKDLKVKEIFAPTESPLKLTPIFADSETILAIGGSKLDMVFSWKSKELDQDPRVFRTGAGTSKWTTNGKILVTSNEKDLFRVYDLKSGKRLANVPLNKSRRESCLGIAMNSLGSRVAVKCDFIGESNCEIRVFDTDTKEVVFSKALNAWKDPSSAPFGFVGENIVAVGGQGRPGTEFDYVTLVGWDIRTGEIAFKGDWTDGKVTSIRIYGENGEHIVCGSEYGTKQTTLLFDGTKVLKHSNIQIGNGRISFVKSKLLLCCSNGYDTRIWDVAEGRRLVQFELRVDGRRQAGEPILSTAGDLLIATGRDCGLALIDVDDLVKKCEHDVNFDSKMIWYELDRRKRER